MQCCQSEVCAQILAAGADANSEVLLRGLARWLERVGQWVRAQGSLGSCHSLHHFCMGTRDPQQKLTFLWNCASVPYMMHPYALQPV